MFYKILQIMLKIPALQKIRFVFFLFDSLMLCFIKKPKKEEKKKLLVVFPLALGDAVMMIGSLEELYNVFHKEKYMVSIICHTPYKGLFEKYVDDVIPIDLHKASTSPKARIEFLKTCRKNYYDIIIDPTGSEECTPGVFAVNASVGGKKIGVLSDRQKKYQLPGFVRKKVFDRVISMEERDVHRVRYYAEVFSRFSQMNLEPQLANLSISNELDLPDEYVIIFPSASMPIKRWPVDNYVEITKRIYNKTGIPIVICGTGVDVDITNKFKSLLDDNIKVLDYINKTNVMTFIELIGRSSLVLTNDTSVYHIAVATRRNTCCITGDYSSKMFIDYEADGLVPDGNVKAVMPNWECANCENNCSKVVGETYPCVLANTVDKVWENICDLMKF